MDADRRIPQFPALTGNYDLAEMTITSADESDLIAALRARDESAFAALVDTHAAAMLRVARGYVATREIAEEVVQEAWIALLKGIDTFEADHRCAPGCSRC